MKGPLRKLIEQIQEWRANIPTGGYFNHDSSVYDNGKEAGYDSVLDTAEMLLAHRAHRDERPLLNPECPLEFMDMPAREFGVHWEPLFQNDRLLEHRCRGQVLEVWVPGTLVRFKVCLRCGGHVKHALANGLKCPECSGRGEIESERSGGTWESRPCAACDRTGRVELRQAPK